MYILVTRADKPHESVKTTFLEALLAAFKTYPDPKLRQNKVYSGSTHVLTFDVIPLTNLDYAGTAKLQ